MLTLEFRAMQVRIPGAVSAEKLEPAAIARYRSRKDGDMHAVVDDAETNGLSY